MINTNKILSTFYMIILVICSYLGPDLVLSQTTIAAALFVFVVAVAFISTSTLRLTNLLAEKPERKEYA